jgi:hypothetical protein
MQSPIIIHPFQLPAGGISPSHTSLHALPGNNIYITRLSIIMLNKAYPSKIKDFTSNHARLLAGEFVLPKVY